MAKYLILWQVDQTRVPADPKERGALWSGMADMVKQNIKEGVTLDWGCFVGETNGYAVAYQTDLELSANLQRYYPFVTFKVYPVMSVEQAGELAKALTG